MGEGDDTDSELEEEVEHYDEMKLNENQESISLDEINHRRSVQNERYQLKKKKIEEQEFLNNLRMFSLTTPSLEYIPEFKAMVIIM